MGYSWGYIKEAALVEMDITKDTAVRTGLINKFPFFANAILTQICSAVKPNWSTAMFKVRNKEKLLQELILKYDTVYFNEFSGYNEWQLRKGLIANGELDLLFLKFKNCQEEDLNHTQKLFFDEYKSHTFLNEEVKMPEDFISFGSDAPFVIRIFGNNEEVFDTDVRYINSKSLIFFTEGVFHIPYNARWFTFLPTLQDSFVLDIPEDILDCLPLYIASQCLKIDDEQKSTILRNELEAAISRIDDTHFVKNKTFKRDGGW